MRYFNLGIKLATLLLLNNTAFASELGFTLPENTSYKVTDQQLNTALKLLEKNFNTDPEKLKKIINHPCICGPGLWHLIKDSPQFIIPPRIIGPTKIPVGTSGKTHALPFAVFKTEDEENHLCYALSPLLKTNGPLHFRLPNENEVKSFLLTAKIKKINEPILIAEGSQYHFLILFAKGKPFLFDELRTTSKLPSNKHYDMKKLCGFWRYSTPELNLYYLFNEDGTFSSSLNFTDGRIWKSSGKWSLDDTVLTYEIKESNHPGFPPGSKDEDVILELTNDHYILKNQDGDDHQYFRIP